jgi:glycosyltransferase 2 family protein
MHMPGVKKFGKRVLQIGLPVVILALFLYQVKKNWSELTAYSFHWNPWLLALAFLGFMLQELSYGLIWRTVLARLGSRLGLRVCLRIYLASEFVRYIPGNVWHVLTRILWVGKYGVSRPVAFSSMAIELVTKLAAGMLVFSISLLFWRDYGAIGSLLHGPLVDVLGVASILTLLIGLHPRVLNGVLNWALRKLKREPVQLTLRYSDILLITLAWCASWIVAGCAFYVLLLSLWPDAPLVALPVCIGIYALAWDIGFVSFITPSGLGIREAAIVALFALALPLPTGLASIMALLSRFVSTIAEVVSVGIAYLSGEKQVLKIQQDIQARLLLKKNTGKETQVSKNLTLEIPTNVPVDRGVMSE